MAKLHATEKKYVEGAVAKRQAEFSTGRILAARAIRELGCPGQPILKGESHEPIWPLGIVGSISHSSEFCIVALARETVCGGIGIDIEECDSSVREIADIVLRPEELDDAFDQKGAELDNAIRLAFSAKESVFKATFAQVKRFIEFEEVRLTFKKKQQKFGATAPNDRFLNQLVSCGKGAYLSVESQLVTGFYLPKIQ